MCNRQTLSLGQSHIFYIKHTNRNVNILRGQFQVTVESCWKMCWLLFVDLCVSVAIGLEYGDCCSMKLITHVC